MIELAILTPWLQMNDATNVPLISMEYPLTRFEDVTDQPSAQIPPSPNVFVARILIDPARLDDLRNDSRFCILWQEETRTHTRRLDKMTTQEAESIATYLDRLTNNKGRDIIGSDAHALSRSTVAFRIKTWAKGLKRG